MYPCKPPAPLRPGDLLQVIAPSGTLRELEAFYQGVELWQARGYRVELTNGFDGRWGYLAGTDGDRRQQLLSALKNPVCRGILCARGGYGGTRLLEDWQWPLEIPKWLIGFSDVTSLLWSLGQQQVSGVHGPLLTTLVAEPEWSRQRLFDWVEGKPIPALEGKGWGGGEAVGLLLPANLSVATHLLGTIHQPALEGVVLALEEVTEAPYRIDRMLTYWRMIGALQGVKAIVLGRFSRCEPPAEIPSFTVAEVLRDRLGDLGIPVVSDLPFGHDGCNAALPVGVEVRVDGDRGLLEFKSGAAAVAASRD